MLSKEQALGYVVLAGKKLKLSEEELKELIYTIEEEMEIWTEEWAEQTYDNWRGK